MKNARRVLLLAIVFIEASCGGGGSSGGGSSPPPGPPAVVIASPLSPLPPAVIGVPIPDIIFTATGTGPFTWTVTAGTLTPGLALSTGGILSGTPTTAGNFSFTVTASDANGSDSNVFTQIVGSSLGETEPNNTTGTADPYEIGLRSTGTITANDVDCWFFPATAGQVIRVELFGIRRDLASWDTNGNRPRLSLVGPNGTDFLAGHDYDSAGAAGWQWGDHDLDIPLYAIPADGIYFVRIDSYLAATPGGSYVLAVTDVTPGTLQEESEGNDDATTADAITPGLVRGVRVDGNDDFFSFTINAPTLVYFEVTAYRNGVFGLGGTPDDDYFDPLIELIDTDESTVLGTNDRVFFNDPAIHFHLVNSGTYFLRVTESGAGTDGDGDYYISFTATPVGSLNETETNDTTGAADAVAYGDVVTGAIAGGDTDFYAFSGTAGDMIRIFWFEFGASQAAGDFISIDLMTDDTTFALSASSTTGVISMACRRAILPATGTYYIRITPDGGATSYAFQLELFKSGAFETEANDTTGTANAIPGGNIVAGVIATGGDFDVFSFSAAAGEVVVFSMYAGVGASSNGFPRHTGYGSTLLPNIAVTNVGGTVLGATPYTGTTSSGESVVNGLATCELAFVAPSAGTFYIRVSQTSGGGDANSLYLLERR